LQNINCQEIQKNKNKTKNTSFFVSLGSLCFATDEDGCAVENVCNTLFNCVYNLHEEIFCLIVYFNRYN
jgi:hypothetical protein